MVRFSANNSFLGDCFGCLSYESVLSINFVLENKIRFYPTRLDLNLYLIYKFYSRCLSIIL
nr:MAG TPA: hypothetical protein [Caudoviricetes sp.]